MHDLLHKLEEQSKIIKNLKLSKQIKNINITNELDKDIYNFHSNHKALSTIVQFIELFHNTNQESKQTIVKWIRDLLSPKNFYGTFCEITGYYWLNKHGVNRINFQVKLTNSYVYNNNEADLDGCIYVGDKD